MSFLQTIIDFIKLRLLPQPIKPVVEEVKVEPKVEEPVSKPKTRATSKPATKTKSKPATKTAPKKQVKKATKPTGQHRPRSKNGTGNK